MTAQSPIVVGVDGSSAAMHAVRWAAVDAARQGAELLLVNVVTTADMYVPAMYSPPIDVQGTEHAARELLIAASVIAQEEAGPVRHVAVSTRVIRGPVGPALLGLSKDARMIVVGSRGMGAFGRGLLGSVSSTLPRHAHCPVAVVHAPPDDAVRAPKGRVVVGVDGSPNSVPAIEIAFGEASRRGADLVAVHAWSDTNEPYSYRIAWPDIEASEEALLAECLAGWAERYPDVSVRRIVVPDSATKRIFEESERADLVVVGSHGRGGFAGMTLGSTSQALLHSVHCPIIIARSDV